MNREEMDKKIKGSRMEVMDGGRIKGLTSCSVSFLLSCSVVSLSSAVPKRDSVFSTSQKTTTTTQKLFFLLLSTNFTFQSGDKNKT